MAKPTETTILLLIVLFALLIGTLFSLVIILISQRLKRLENEQTAFWLQESKRVEMQKTQYLESLPLRRLPTPLPGSVGGQEREVVMGGKRVSFADRHMSYESRRALLESSAGSMGERSSLAGLIENDEAVRRMYKTASWQGTVR